MVTDPSLKRIFAKLVWRYSDDIITSYHCKRAQMKKKIVGNDNVCHRENCDASARGDQSGFR